MDLTQFTATTWVGAALTVVLALGIIYVGVSYLVTPASMAPNFGFRAEPTSGAVPWQHIKGPRDIVSGIVPVAVLVAGGPGLAALVLLIEALIPLGDALTIIRHRGRLAAALGIHVATAAGMVVIALLLLV
jgi:hypothetical protein